MPGKCWGVGLEAWSVWGASPKALVLSEGRQAWTAAPVWEGHHPLGLGMMGVAEAKRGTSWWGHSHEAEPANCLTLNLFLLFPFPLRVTGLCWHEEDWSLIGLQHLLFLVFAFKMMVFPQLLSLSRKA